MLPTIETAEYVDVEIRSAELGLAVPLGFSILPRNFEQSECRSDLVHEDTAPTIRTLLREDAGIVDSPLDANGPKIPYIKERSAEWVGPVIFIGASVFSQNPHLISVALNVISAYLTDYFRGIAGSNKVKLGIVVPQPRTNKYIRINYEGDVSGLKNLNEIIKEVRNGRSPRAVGKKQ